jgi:hypothetical protein
MLMACVPTQRPWNPSVSCASLKLFCCRCRQPLSRSRDAISDVHNAKSYYVMNAKTHIITLWSAQETHTQWKRRSQSGIFIRAHTLIYKSAARRVVQPHKFLKRLSASTLVCECTGLLVSHLGATRFYNNTYATSFPPESRLLLRFSR